MSKLISISLSPNVEKDDVLLAFKLIFQPWRWKKGKAIEELEKEFKEYLDVKHAFSFNSGRSSLMAILNSLGLEKDSEVLLQAFTCNAAVNPIIWTGLKPVFVDVNEKTFNMDAEDLRKKITLRRDSGQAPRVVMVQHTFGLSADMDEILEICQKNNLILIEDCAHALGAKYKSKKVGLPADLSAEARRTEAETSAKAGTFGKAAFFSFSRDKVISSVYGGVAVTNDGDLAEKIKKYQEKSGFPCYDWILQQLLHPILMNWLVLPIYSIFGKYLLILFQWFQVLSKAVHWKEKRAMKPYYFPKRLPNALAILALNQFKKLEKFNRHRREIANFYSRELLNTKYRIPDTKYLDSHIFLRFSIKHPKAHEIIKNAWRKNLLIGDWYTTPIAPHDTKLDKMQYISGSCPTAERLAKETLNLPTHINISKEDAQRIVEFLKNYGN
ncbi:MAG: hypothetical protein A2175_02400 [Candidatus Nealsonbacteria bacterium RBG_13_42_11]|uniref:DegT/DnrJ/EryC1/StrS aminotransferase n=1 Tax=Candidatus Nealsonbacteria bacterium RBG_13_42_11 TaxID=1801663 RepID=A0A1G2E0P9_9BACT|nr:MAG: hypothetical protein A2175_02400 [Candidatus Nealsonbacteria bacterium RBG_13_42_11]